MEGRLALSRAVCTALVFGVCWPSLADEVTVQNDSLQDGAQGAVQAGFIAGETAAAWLTSPCDGSIVAVQVMWLSVFGNTGQSLEESIIVYADGSFPVPGKELAFFDSPLMTDGFLNEFRYLDKNNTVPLDVPINAGERFIVAFTFANTPSIFSASVVTDTNGCQAQKNGVFTLAPSVGWFNFCSFGPSGDFVIRGVVDCADLPGACCLPAGGCIGDLTEQACDASGGVFQGGGSTCGGITCPQPGACCLPNGDCLSAVTSTQCAQQGGTYQGNGTSCDGANCPQPPGACCFVATGGCLSLSAGDCNAAGGVFQGPGVLCNSGVCSQGACCFDTGFCLALTEDECDSVGATFSGLLTQCNPDDTCPGGKTCPTDLNDDGSVGPADLGNLLAAWGSDPDGPPDFNDDNIVNAADLGELLAGWGPCL